MGQIALIAPLFIVGPAGALIGWAMMVLASRASGQDARNRRNRNMVYARFCCSLQS
jgi:hypothetical protein